MNRKQQTKTAYMQRTKRITSADQALAEARKLECHWSRETELSQRVLIYMAELLEKLTKRKRATNVQKQNSQ